MSADVVDVVADMFPATMRIGTDVRSTVRASITPEHVTVRAWDGGTGIVVLVDQPILSISGAGRRLQVATSEGVYDFEPGSGCGCGNPLRSFNAWPGKRVRRVAV